MDLDAWRAELVERCPHCSSERHWSSRQPDAVSSPPSGHTIHRTPDGSTYDVCPRAPRED